VWLPPRPLCAGAFLSGTKITLSRPNDGDARSRVPDDDLFAHDARDESPLIVAKAARLDELARRQIEPVAVHRTGDAPPPALSLAEARSRMVARIFDREWAAIHEGDEYMKRRVHEASQRVALQTGTRHLPHELHAVPRPTPTAA
jgi:hypothetical protein